VSAMRSEAGKAAAAQEGRRWPSDTRMFGVVVDREHSKVARQLIRHTRNRDAKNLLRAWRRSGYPFCIVGGHLHLADGPMIGGVAVAWNSALILLRTVFLRFDSLAEDSISFSSAWVFLTTRERHEQASAMIAQAQQTAGSA
jgi:hypothetical protein